MPPSDSAVRTFAILYVIGNIITLCATGFLLTPKSQWSKMWDETRRYTTAFYLTMLIVVFALAVTVSSEIFCLTAFLSLFVSCDYIETKRLAGSWNVGNRNNGCDMVLVIVHPLWS
jgi:hypothetical protein